MASTIRIKRSDTSGNPAVLATGELAYSALAGTQSNGGDRLYIGQGTETAGNAANHLVIGGKYFTDMLDHVQGTLTANSAIVVDASSKIDILNVDNITLNGNTISSTDANGNLIFAPNGIGKISFYNAYTFPSTDGTAGFVISTNGSGALTWTSVTSLTAGLANTATNIAGGTAGQVPYQTGAGATSFYGPGTAGQILLSAGTGAPVYTNTASIYVGFSNKADAWAAARTLTLAGDLGGSVAFDGSGNFTLTATIQANSVTLGTDTTGDYVATGATSGFGISGSTTGETATFTVTSNATSTNANSTLVLRDGSGNFSAGIITATLTGVATSATNVVGGTAGQLVYQSSPGVTAFVGPGTTGQVLVSQGTSAPVYQNTLTLAGTTNATSTITGAFITFGGAGIGQDVYIGGGLDILSTQASTGTVNQNALYVAGGVGIAGSLYVTGPAVFQNDVTFSGTATYVYSTQTIYTDNILNLHVNGTSITNPWTVDDGKDIGLIFHNYVDNADNDAFFGWVNDSGYLEWYDKGTESSTGTFTGSRYGTFKTGKIILTATTASNSTNTGALTVAGGVGIGQNLYVGGTIFGNLTGLVTTATNVAGGTAGQLVYQSAPGVTAYAGPGTAGQILLSAGTGAPVYTNTASIYVGFANKADAWSAARTITLAGDLDGSVAFDGSSNFTLTATIQANSVVLGTDTTGDYVATGATSGFGISGSTTGETATFTVTSNATSTNANSTLVLRNGSGNFSAGTITATLTGVATSATNVTGGTAGQLVYQSAPGVTAYAGPGTAGQLLVSAGTGAPVYTNTGSIHVGIANLATNLIGGASYSIPYQSVGSVTAFLALGPAGQVLQVNTAGNALIYGDIDGGTY